MAIQITTHHLDLEAVDEYIADHTRRRDQLIKAAAEASNRGDSHNVAANRLRAAAALSDNLVELNERRRALAR